jgi:hypothetical protein
VLHDHLLTCQLSIKMKRMNKIKLVDRYVDKIFRFLNGETFNINMEEFIYPQTQNNERE